MNFTRSIMLGIVLAAPAGGVSAEERAAQTQSIKLDIAPQPLGNALNEFAKQAKLQLVLYSRIGEGLRSPKISGTLSPDAALSQLLDKTGLRYEYLSADTVAIFSQKKPDAAVPVASPISGTPQELMPEPFRLVLQLDGDEPTVTGDTSGEKPKKTKKSDAVEEMIVEKSKIKPFSDANADLPRSIDDHQPYYIFSSKEIERSGALTIQDFLRLRLTMDTTYETNAEMVAISKDTVDRTISSTMDYEGIPGSAVSSFNLRGLGVGKTLILVNGRRIAGINYFRSGNATQDERQPDLNGIPLSAVDRIEVLPSSASAIYGGSAIGGVINVILKRSYQGGDVRVSHNKPSNSNAFTSMASATYGFSFEGGKSQVMASASYSTSEPMILNDRAEFVESGLKYLWRRAAAGLDPGSPTSPNSVLESSLVNNFRAGVGPTGTYIYWGGNDNLILRDGTVVLQGTANNVRLGYIKPGVTSATPLLERFNPFGPELFSVSPGYGRFGAKQPLGTSSEVKAFNTSFTRQMNNWLETFAEFRLDESRGETLYEPNLFMILEPNFPGNPFGNSRVDFVTTVAQPYPISSLSQTRTATAGVKAHFPGGWAGEMSYTRSENKFNHSYGAPDAVTFGLYVSLGWIDGLVDPFTVDLNVDSFNQPQPYGSGTRSDVVSLRLAGPVLHLPWGDPMVSIGVERYKPSRPDGENGTVNWCRSGSFPNVTRRICSITTYLARSTANYAFYVEGTLPLITEKNSIPLIRSLDVQVAQRLSRSIAQTGTVSMTVNYNPAGLPTTTSYSPTPIGGIPSVSEVTYNSNNGTFGLRYQPVEEVTLRASVGTAFVPPTYSQLVPDQRFTPAAPNGQTITDPLTNTSYRVDSISGGNPNLKPQRSLSRDVGVIYEPRSALLRGLRANLQYYQIGQFDFISAPNVTELFMVPEFANRVVRDPRTQAVTQVDLSLTNIAEYSSAGVDLTLGYDKDTALGNWHFSLGGTKIIYERRQTTAASPMLDYAGYPGNGGPVKYKANASLVWSAKQWTLGWTTNWYGSYRLDGSPGSPTGFRSFRSTAWVLQGSYSVPSQMYHHIFAGYDFGRNSGAKLLSGLAMQLNVENVFNIIPPFDVTRQPFYLSSLGSYRLRTYTLGIKKAF